MCFLVEQVHEKSLLLASVPASLVLLLPPSASHPSTLANKTPHDDMYLYLLVWFQLFVPFTLYPLLKKDGLSIPYVVFDIIFCTWILLCIQRNRFCDDNASSTDSSCTDSSNKVNSKAIIQWMKSAFIALSSCGKKFVSFLCYVIEVCDFSHSCCVLGMLTLHWLEIWVEPPQRYPDLYPALFAIFGLLNLLCVYVYGLQLQHLANADLARLFDRARLKVE